MPNTPNRNYYYPAKGIKPYFTDIETTFNDIDSDVQSLYDSIVAENIWNRTGSIITTNVAGDGLSIAATGNTAGEISLITNGGTAETIVLTNTQGTLANAIDINASAGGIDIDAVGNIAIDSSTGSCDITTENGISLYAYTANGIVLYSEAGIDAAINGQWKIQTDSTATDGIRINATGGGGIDMDASGGGPSAIIDLNAAAGISLTGGGTGGISATTSLGNIVLNSAGFLDIDTVNAVDIDSAGVDIDSSGTVSINTSGTGFISMDVPAGQSIGLNGTPAANSVVMGTSSATKVELNAIWIDLNAEANGLSLTSNSTSSTAINMASSGGIDVDAAGVIDIATSYGAGQYAINFSTSNNTMMKFNSSGGINLKGGPTGVVHINSSMDANDGGSVLIGHQFLDNNINLTTRNADINIQNAGTGSVVLTSSGGDIWFSDQHKAASTYVSQLAISDSSADWDTFEANYGEVSLLNALNQAGNKITPTIVTTATYTVLVTDTVLAIDRSLDGECIITIPSALIALGYQLTIIDSGGNASLYKITIETEGSETINDEPDAEINGSYSSISLLGLSTSRLVVR